MGTIWDSCDEFRAINIIDLLMEIGETDSRGQAKRLVREGAISFNGKKITDVNSNLIFRKPKGDE